jgi:MFS family permease
MSPDTDTPAKKQSPLTSLLRSRSFVALFASSTLGVTGENMRIAAQSWWILDVGGSNTQVGLAAGLRIIPLFILTLYAGVLVDRVGGKRVMIAMRSVLLLLAVATALILFSANPQIWQVITIAVVAGGVIAFGMPASQTLVAEIVPEDIRPSANSLFQVGSSVGSTAGPLLVSVLIAVRDAGTAFLGLVTVYAISILGALGITSARQQTTSDESTWKQLIEGFRYVRRTPILLWIITLDFAIVFYGMVMPIVPAYATQVLDASAVQYGWMWGALALGQGLTGLVMAIFGVFKRSYLMLVSAASVFTVGMVIFGLSETYLVSLGGLFVTGIAFPLWGATLITLVQKHSDARYRGRVLAIFSIPAFQGGSVAWMLGGVLLDAIGEFETVAVCLVGGWVMLLAALAFSRDLRNA